LLDVLDHGTFTPLGADREVRVDVRLVFAANESLDDLVAQSRMLNDFVARLGLFRIIVPPLRDRPADIPVLVRNMIAEHAPRLGYADKPLPTVTPSLEQALTEAEWRHNLRELDSVMRRLLVDAGGAHELRVSLLTGDLAFLRRRATRLGRGERAPSIQEAIDERGGNKAQAARDLGISRATLYRHQRVASTSKSPPPTTVIIVRDLDL
jgi:DNA-binding NtrC family response regulator